MNYPSTQPRQETAPAGPRKKKKISKQGYCKICGAEFHAESNRAKYCPVCRVVEERMSKLESQRKIRGTMEKITRTIPEDDSDLQLVKALPKADPDCYRAGLLKIAVMIIARTYEDITSDAKNISNEVRSEAVDWWQTTAFDFHDSIGTTLPMPKLSDRTYQPEMIG
jgi:hypothetical protein